MLFVCFDESPPSKLFLAYESYEYIPKDYVKLALFRGFASIISLSFSAQFIFCNSSNLLDAPISNFVVLSLFSNKINFRYKDI